jgi:Domain of unknown function (DUF4115)
MSKFLAKLNNPVAFIVAVVLFVAFNGYLFYVYGYQQQSQSSVGANQPTAETYPASDESSADPSPEQEADSEAEEVAAPEVGATTGEEANSGEAARAEEGATPSQEEAAAEGALRTGVSVVDAPTLLSIRADGESVLEGVIEPGFSRQFEADGEITISTDNAGAVLVEVNGYSLGALGASGEPATRTFTAGA